MIFRVEFYFDFGSFNVYFSYLVIFVIEECMGVMFEYFLILFGGVFKLMNNVLLVVLLQGIQNKFEYQVFEM